MACTGHAIAMGSFLLCSGDHRIAAPGYNIQANEVAIGMVLPYAALEVLKLRLTRAAYQQAVGLAKVYFGEAALAAGWIDEIALPDAVLERAEESARSSPNCTAGHMPHRNCGPAPRHSRASGRGSTI